MDELEELDQVSCAMSQPDVCSEAMQQAAAAAVATAGAAAAPVAAAAKGNSSKASKSSSSTTASSATVRACACCKAKDNLCSHTKWRRGCKNAYDSLSRLAKNSLSLSLSLSL